MHLQRYEKAILYLSAAAGLGNKQFRAYFLLANALLQINDVRGARQKLEHALSINPNYREARERLSGIEMLEQSK